MSGVPVMLFARTPEPGRVNTRLIPALGEQGAARLHAAMLRWKAAELSEKYSDLQLWVSPSAEHPLIIELAKEYGFELYVQSGRDLGERMGRALEAGLDRAPGAVLLGTDCPSLPGSAVGEARALLDEYDAIFSPAEDGGFGLVAVSRFDPRLFEGVPWGTDRVMDAVRQRLGLLGWRWHELAPCWDVDRPADLKRLYEYPGTPVAIRELLEGAVRAVLE